ncbi:MAG TPA: isocitrate lyase/phosphoenolpyruvate mutase family protein [Candidatus Binatia bacterium]|nr:isocitrate lyase/phosphoenolpyruvate mutase family protein [Candidatus Binatia bacterium]
MKTMNHEKHPLTDWSLEGRWKGIQRPYAAADVLRLRGSLQIEYTLARVGAERLWELLHSEPYVAALSAMTGNQAVEQARAGLKAIYASGWQAAADACTAREIFPDLNGSSADGVPHLVGTINKALQHADQMYHAEGRNDTRWFLPVVADAECRAGGSLNAFELMKSLIEAGAAGVTFKDQVFAVNTFGQFQGDVLMPTRAFLEKLIAARLAADVMGVPALLIARTDAYSARYLENDADPQDGAFLTAERRTDGYFGFRGGLEAAIARGLAYAPYADLLLFETPRPDLREARRFAAAIHATYPGKLLAYNCSPPLDWSKQLDGTTIRNFQGALSGMGFRFQFVALAGYQSVSLGMFELARRYREAGMAAFARLHQAELELAHISGCEALKPLRNVGAGYFDEVARTIAGVASGNGAAIRASEEPTCPEAEWAPVSGKRSN